YQQALNLRPTYNEAHFNLALALLALRDRAGALEEYALLKSADPGLAAQLGEQLFRSKVVRLKSN
ncbi:MAG TPA: hypothetical protein VGN86_12025, partial [Pyrinomonadaceae bacterium]|nr:hypothetical protein [Pyrinomonadaceae bacterium]